MRACRQVANATNLVNNSDYPSAHTVYGWSWGLVLAELDPDRATDIMIRALAYRESRVVCTVHNASAIEAGRMIAGSLRLRCPTQPTAVSFFHPCYPSRSGRRSSCPLDLARCIPAVGHCAVDEQALPVPVDLSKCLH